MFFDWIDYCSEDAPLIDDWMDDCTCSMTGIDQGWDAYWQAVIADSIHFPGCRDFCKIICLDGAAVAVIVFGCFEGIGTVSEIVVAKEYRGRGIGTRILRELAENSETLTGENVRCFRAVVFPENTASQKMFQKAGFVFSGEVCGSFVRNYEYEIC